VAALPAPFMQTRAQKQGGSFQNRRRFVTCLGLGYAMRRRLLAAVVCLTCVCLLGARLRLGSPAGHDKQAEVLLEGGGERRQESLAALEHERARLQTFISREGSARHIPHVAAKSEQRQSDAEGVAPKERRWPDAESRRWHRALEQKAGRGKRCGKLCQTRKAILAARGRIDAQAHVELQQLAVSP
jgi:hypothetical protein